MSTRLTRDELMRRQKDQASTLMVQTASLLQGGVLSAAAYSLIEILKSRQLLWIEIMLWLISVILGLVIYFRLCHRAIYLMQSGIEVVVMLPIMCLFEIVLFAILASSAFGPDGWRYWYLADVALFVVGYVAEWINLRALRADHYAPDLAAVFTTLRGTVRRQVVEGVGAGLLTVGLAAWILTRPPGWPYATAFVAVHLGLTIVTAAVIVAQEAREMSALRQIFPD